MKRSLVALTLPALMAAQIRVVVSSRAGDRLTEKPPVAFETTVPAGLPVINVDPSRRFQTIDGFGATFNEAGLMVLNRLPKDEQEAVLKAVFDPRQGAGFSLMKAPLAACDFAAAGPWYTYDDVPGDTGLEHFSIERDLGPNGQLTFIRRARQYGQFGLQSTTDYPPDWMLASEKLRREYYPVFARYLVKYVQEYRKHGIDIDYLAPFNEPEYVYSKITHDEIRELLKGYIGPEFKKAGLKTRLQAMESDNRDHGLEALPRILGDPAARQFVSTITVHGYDWEEQGSRAMARLHELYPGIPVWMTEVCYAKTIDKKPMPVWGFDDGDRWGRMLIADLKNWASGWIYWNLILDHKGGPWLVSPEHGDPEDNPQHPVVIVNPDTAQVTYTGLYYYLAHFSKYVRPGVVRIEAAGSVPEFDVVAFLGRDGRRTLVAVNSARLERRFALREGRRIAAIRVPARSIATLEWR